MFLYVTACVKPGLNDILVRVGLVQTSVGNTMLLTLSLSNQRLPLRMFLYVTTCIQLGLNDIIFRVGRAQTSVGYIMPPKLLMSRPWRKPKRVLVISSD